MTSRTFVFALTAQQMEGLVALVEGVEGAAGHHLKKGNQLSSAAVALLDAHGQQVARWDRCEKCEGSGWVESDAPAS